MHAAGRFLYVSNPNRVDVYSVDASSGALTLSSTPFIGPTGAIPKIVALDATGKFAFGINCCLSTGADVFAYNVDATTGNLTAVQGSTVLSTKGYYDAAVTTIP